MVRITVLYFGIVRERIGMAEERYELDPGSRVEDLLHRIESVHGSLAEGVASLRVAVNSEYVDSEHSLSENDEVAIIPPVSGG
jgi:molybdopterin converting factor subunit 1